MLTTSAIKKASGAAQYYSNEDNYYLSEVDAKEASMWLGEGAARLGLSGKVEEKTLHDLLSSRLPNDNVIGLQKDGTINHRPGYDLCFQAPKSVSILALDGGDKRLYDAHLAAIKETLKIIERVQLYNNCSSFLQITLLFFLWQKSY
jgi:TrwC relaxase.